MYITVLYIVNSWRRVGASASGRLCSVGMEQINNQTFFGATSEYPATDAILKSTAPVARGP